MAECHNKMARKKIAEKKAKANEEKLEELVDQLKGRIESTDTAEVEMIKSDLKNVLERKSNNRFIHIYPETRRP